MVPVFSDVKANLRLLKSAGAEIAVGVDARALDEFRNGDLLGKQEVKVREFPGYG